MSSLQTVEQFINHVFSGNMEGALDLVAPNAQFISTRPTPSAKTQIFGTHIGKEGAQTFFRLFGESLEPGDFTISARFSEGEHVALYGSLRHKSRKTGREFASDWAMICRVQEGRLSFYHFYEDTAALEEACL